ncbi:hypothetical protein TrVGV298_011515 [Trichoderma virens]|nr:hypothetical protein TrVGV298_011515 [Trichoderma virens]
MAPPPRTYGKKKSLLGPLGSRNRSKASMTDSLPAKNPSLGSQSVNICSDTAKRNPRTQNNAQPNSIEELASALLDDSSSELPAKKECHKTGRKRHPRFPNFFSFSHRRLYTRSWRTRNHLPFAKLIEGKSN